MHMICRTSFAICYLIIYFIIWFVSCICHCSDSIRGTIEKKGEQGKNIQQTWACNAKKLKVSTANEFGGYCSELDALMLKAGEAMFRALLLIQLTYNGCMLGFLGMVYEWLKQ